jgi:hypothetical protein
LRYLQSTGLTPHLHRRVDTRPARFVIGLDEDVDWRWLDGTPVNPAFYLGRVEEVTADGSVVTTLWERPSGREAFAPLSLAEHFAGQAPSPGDLLRIWTWMELREDQPPVDHYRIEVETQTLSEEERELLTELVDELKREA